MTTEEYMLSLLNSAIRGEPAPERPANISPADVFHCAKKHKLENICYEALKSIEPADDDLMKSWSRACAMNTAQAIVQENEKERLSKAFNAAGIAFLPLKGWQLRSMYPKAMLRFMSDIDILIHREDRARAMDVMHSLGYSGGGDAISYDEGYQLPPYLHTELHFDIVGQDQGKWFDYYQSIWEKAIFVSDCEYRLSRDDFYIHMVVNFAKDYLGKGVGLRAVLDLYFFLAKHEQELNRDYIKKELEKLGLSEIESQLRALSRHWFEAADLSYRSPMAAKLLEDGVYGSHMNFVENYYKKTTADIRIGLLRKPIYLLRRAFPGYREMSYTYPVLKKAPYLLPFYWVKRILTRRNRIALTFNALRRIKG